MLNPVVFREVFCVSAAQRKSHKTRGQRRETVLFTVSVHRVACSWSGSGQETKRFRREPGSSSALTEVFSRLVTAMYSKERKRFPEELFLPGFPTRDNLQTGTEDSQPPSHHPEPRPSRRRSHSSIKSPFKNQKITILMNVFIIALTNRNHYHII